MAWNSGTDTGSVSRLGATNGGSDKRSLFLKQFAGEVLTSFEERNIFMPLHRVRTISNGKSAQFPVTGTSSAAYHTAGDTIYGGSVNASEITVTVDDLLVSSTFVPKIDEAMNHYDVRSIYSSEMGNALSNAADKNIASIIYQAATGAGTADQEVQWTNADFAGLSNGSTGAKGKIDIATPASEGTATYTAQNIVDGIINSLMTFDKHDVTGEKYCVLSPEAYYTLMGADSTAINRDQGGNGSVAGGNVPTVGGVKILMSNHLPTADTGSVPLNESGRGATPYTGSDAFDADLKGMVFTKDAAATVKLLDLGVESEYQIERQGTLMVAKYAMGHNALRNKAAIALVA
jgi:hypothetical protein